MAMPIFRQMNAYNSSPNASQILDTIAAYRENSTSPLPGTAKNSALTTGIANSGTAIRTIQGIGIGNQYTDWLTEQGIDLGDVFQTKKDGTYGTYRPDMNPQYHQTTWCADRAIEFIESPHHGPWLMSVNPFDPHGPFDAPDTHKYNPGDLPPPLFCESDLQTQTRLKRFFAGQEGNPPGDREQHNKASYYGMVALIDENVGRMLNALERTGQRENTVVIFTSDHGEMLGDHGLTGKGCRFYEALVRVPLIISWPGTFLQGHRADGLTALLDIAPTLADLAGIPLEWTHGKSLIPILAGEDPGHVHHDFVRCEYYDVVDKFAPHASEKHTSMLGDHVAR